ncbi:hypothetical protein AMECASPLE_035747 [Ameca splendens]|uniref:Uncharacterized protein n=1 Tax=Ameca splendens TaxID=208324 RepID=A0ABV0ZI15_9TELE
MLGSNLISPFLHLLEYTLSQLYSHLCTFLKFDLVRVPFPTCPTATGPTKTSTWVLLVQLHSCPFSTTRETLMSAESIKKHLQGCCDFKGKSNLVGVPTNCNTVETIRQAGSSMLELVKASLKTFYEELWDFINQQ